MITMINTHHGGCGHMNSCTFYNHLLISSIFPFQTEKYPVISPTRRHSFLNGLALLLNGSRSATAVYPCLKTKEIFIAANESFKQNDKIYFKEFFDALQTYSVFCLGSDDENMEKTYSLLKSLMFQFNKDKFVKRLLNPLFNDAVTSLENLSNYDINEIYGKIIIPKLMKGSADYTFLKKKNMSLDEYIEKLFTWLNEMLALRNSIAKDKKNSSLENIETFSEYSESLYHSSIFRLIVSHVYPTVHEQDRIKYYLDKVSAHERSLDLILTCLEQRKNEYGQIYQNIKWKLIEPIEKTVQLNEKPSIIFDQIWLECGLPDDDTKVDFKQKYIGNQLDEYDQNLTLSICVHCEIRLIDYLIKENIHEIHDGDIEIGISKLSCYPCSLYIKMLNKKFNRNFCVSKLTTHGKIYPKWTFRNNEDNSIIDYVNSELKMLLISELQELERRERKKSGDSDKQETELDDDDVYDIFRGRKKNKFTDLK